MSGQIMKHLVIGSNTYDIEEYTLPIASSSTLGGIKVGSGLSIDSSTGVLTASGTSVTIDTAMSDSSTNPVQNKVIKAYSDGLIAALDGGTIGNPGTGKTVSSVSQTNGNISIGFSNISITKSQVSDFSHNHGNITSGGDITATAPTIANGDQLVINDNSASKITNGPTFDGSTTTKALSQKGTWETFLTEHQSLSGYVPTSRTINSKALTSNITLSASDVGASASDHTHTLSIASDSGTSALDMTANTKYKITAGGSTYIFKTPAGGSTYTAGTGLTLNGTAFDHSNSVTAQTTSKLVPIKFDAQGHITEVGSEVTSLSASDVYAWAKAANKPSYTYSEVGAAASSHNHGNITSGGDITATAPTIASGDQLIINDNSTSKITNGPTFDGSTTTKALTQKGTWETFLQSFTETDPTVPSWAKASSKPTYTYSEVGAAASSHDHGNITSGGDITATAPTIASGDQIVINDSSASKITNGPTFDGSTTTKALSQKGTWETFSNTDEKVKSSPTATNGSGTMYLLGSSTSSETTSTVSKHASIVAYMSSGDTGTAGYSRISIGNDIASGTAGSKYGILRLHGNTAYYVDIRTESSTPTANRTIYLPSYAGTMYLTCTSTTDAVGGATTAPVYVNASGQIEAVTSIPYSLLTGTPTIPDVSGKIDTAGSGLSKSGTTLNHESTITAGTVGTSSATSGISIDVPYVTYNNTGHITDSGTHTHTIPTVTTSSNGIMSKEDKIMLDAINDYVTEQNTSGSWIYRKWNSGKVEAWYRGNVSCSAATAVNNVYRSSYSLSIPSGIFSSAPIINMAIDQNASTLMAVMGYASSKTAISGYVFRTGSSSDTYNTRVSVYAWTS